VSAKSFCGEVLFWLLVECVRSCETCIRLVYAWTDGGVACFFLLKNSNFSWFSFGFFYFFVLRGGRVIGTGAIPNDRNLVDPASSHMLVSKIKPCMSQYKFLHNETADGSLKQL
jgi:hypothetical protein